MPLPFPSHNHSQLESESKRKRKKSVIGEMEEKQREKKQAKKHLWKPEEDLILKKYVETHGEGNWATVSLQSGLMRGGKSCRLRWKNYLRPNIKRGGMSQEEEDLIIRMHKLLGNRWSLIAGRLPGRTDNEVKNYWNTHLNKRCPRGKRKHCNSNDNKNDSNSSETKNKEEKINDPHQNLTECPKNTTEGVEGKKEDEKSIAINPLAGDTNRFNYDIDSPIITPANCSMFFFDAEPLTTYMDSFLLFEAVGYTAGEENYAEIGMHSIIP